MIYLLLIQESLTMFVPLSSGYKVAHSVKDIEAWS